MLWLIHIKEEKKERGGGAGFLTALRNEVKNLSPACGLSPIASVCLAAALLLGLAVIFLLPIAANAADWTPAEITTLGWWDASDESSISDTGGNVTQINDKSGNNAHLENRNGNPTTGTRTQNGLNVLDHDGATWMEAPSMTFPASGNVAFFMVAVIDEIDDENDSVYGLNNDTPTEFSFRANSGLQFNGKIFVSGIGENLELEGGPFHGPSIYNANFDWDSSVLNAYIDGNCRGSNNSYNYDPNVPKDKIGTTTDFHAFAKLGNALQRPDGAWGEMIIVEDVTSATREKIEGYLAWKWGIEANLPSDHPYKSAAPVVSEDPTTATLTGTLADGAAYAEDIVAGGKTLIITLTNATWDATIGDDNAKTTALINGICADASPDYGWNNVVKAHMDYNDIDRSSDTVVQITLGAEATYAISETETITVTVPATATSAGSPIVATPTFQISPPTANLTGTLGEGAAYAEDIVAGGKTLIITLANATWDATIGDDNAKTTALINGICADASPDYGWNNLVKAHIDYNDIDRSSDTVVQITLGAEATYAISETETITVTVPATATSAGSPIVATPTFDILCNYTHWNKITIDCAEVSADLSDFPFLFDVTDDHLADLAHDGYVTDASGDDIIFMCFDATSCGGTAPCTLDHEIEEYDPNTGHLVVWMRIPLLSDDTSTDIYIYYGNSCVDEPTENPEGVWDPNFAGVWHLKESSDGSYDDFKDSTSNDHHGRGWLGNSDKTPTQTSSGKIGNAQSFDGGDGIFMERSGSKYYGVVGTSSRTISAWIKTSEATNDQSIVSYGDQDGAGGQKWQQRLDQSSSYKMLINPGGSDIVGNTGSLNDGAWHYVAATLYDDGSPNANEVKYYVDGENDGTDSPPDQAINTLQVENNAFRIGLALNTGNNWDGIIDEVRISNTARSAAWIATEYNNQSSPSTFYSYDPESVSTAVSLAYFTATGQVAAVLVSWETAQEVDNLGFYLYRAYSPAGPFTRITDKMIPGLGFSVKGKRYTYEDKEVIRGALCYYRLEDVDIHRTVTSHGPICIDWDSDGMPDDWEIAYGLNPGFDDSGLDPDFDGLTNIQEYEMGTHPYNPDTDGDGILDGDEDEKKDRDETLPTKSVKQRLHVLSSDDAGTTLELCTDDFTHTDLVAEGTEYQRLRIPAYIHGYTTQVGAPELPLKGVLLDLPLGKSATLSIEGTVSTTHPGYRVYPLPDKVARKSGRVDTVEEVFTLDKAAYGDDKFYPREIARLAGSYIARDEQKLHLIFYPLAFNPAKRELVHYSRIRVRIDYKEIKRKRAADKEGASRARASRARAWTPPSSGTSYKITLADEGIYRLDRGYCASLGSLVDEIDLRTIRLYNLGCEVALYIYDQDGDNLLDFGDYSAFYGKPLDGRYAKYTNDNVYFLITDGGEGEPKRMAQLEAAPAGGTIPETFTHKVHYEQDEYYLIMLPGDDALDRWVFETAVQGGGIEWVDQNTPAPGSIVPFTLTLPGVTGAGSLKLFMWGLSDNEHEVALYCNGAFLSTATWEGISSYQAMLSGVDFAAGTNTIGLQCNGETDVIVVDWIEATYPRSFTADNGQFKCTLAAGSRGEVAGLSRSDLQLYDITSPDEAKVAVNFTVTGDAQSYTLDFEPQYGAEMIGEMAFYILPHGEHKLPASLSAYTSSNLSDPNNGADYIVITHRTIGWDESGALYSWLAELVALREGQGLRVKVIDVEALYNEFAYGFPTPLAIREFLDYAYRNWSRPAPQYVLLLGDSTYDYKNNWDLAEQSSAYLPAYLSYTRFMGEGPVDDWFVMLEGGDKAPDIHIGRLPAATAAQAKVMVEKILAYEEASNTKSWEKNVLFFADKQTEDYEALFEIMDEDSSALVPAGLNEPFKGYLDEYRSSSGLRADIKAKINEGSLMVNYSGHGSTQVWGRDSIFHNADVPDLTNERMLPFMVSMTCLTGYFTYPEAWGFPCMAEALLRAEDGGAIAAFMSAAMTDPAEQHILNTALFDALFTEDVRTLGPAVTLAKQTLLANQPGPEVEGEAFHLFADPAMSLKVHIPRMPVNLRAEDEPGDKGGVVLSWDDAADCEGDPVFAYNLYRSATPDGEYSMACGLIPYSVKSYEEAWGRSDTTYYYVLTSVDFDGDESVRSRSVRGRTGTIPGSEPRPTAPVDTSTQSGTVIVVKGLPEPQQDTSNLGKGCFIDSL